MQVKTSPILMVMGGPNGSGKSTITAEYPVIGEYVNADDIQRHLKCSSLEAAQIATATREYFLSQKKQTSLLNLFYQRKGTIYLWKKQKKVDIQSFAFMC